MITKAERTQTIYSKEEASQQTIVSGFLNYHCLVEGSSFLQDFQATLFKEPRDKKASNKLRSLIINGEGKTL
jgi:hypothetical protein